MEISAGQSKNFLYNLLKIRIVDEYIADVYPTDVIKCPIHLSIGSEAVSVGVCSALKKSDMVIGGHRGHGIYLAKGGNLNEFMAEMYGKETGCSGGKGGSMHLISLENGLLGTTPILGSTIPIGVGAALSSKLKNNNKVTAIFYGDGASEEGVYYESLNLAALYKLPVIFVCENNGFSVYTGLVERQPNRPIFRVAEAHGMAAYLGDGNDVEEVLSIAKTAVEMAREGMGPQFVELNTYRWREHCGPDFDDGLHYRTAEEIENGLKACPIVNFAARLKQNNPLFESDLERIEANIQQEIADAFQFAHSSAKPSTIDAGDRIYA